VQKSSEIKVLIAHANPLVSAGLSATLERQRDFRVAVLSEESFASPSKASQLFSPDVIVADYDSGLRLLTFWDRVVILTHTDSEAKICHALEQGARGYLFLDCGLQDLLDGLRSVHAGGIALAPLGASRVADRMKHKPLTLREGQVLRYVMTGLSNKAIAAKLTLSEETVKTHVKSILSKLDVRSRTGAAAIAQRRGLLSEDCDWTERSGREVGIRGPGGSRAPNFRSRMPRAKYQNVLAPAATS
jgi:two-component system NarL family response regulator